MRHSAKAQRFDPAYLHHVKKPVNRSVYRLLNLFNHFLNVCFSITFLPQHRKTPQRSLRRFEMSYHPQMAKYRLPCGSRVGISMIAASGAMLSSCMRFALSL